MHSSRISTWIVVALAVSFFATARVPDFRRWVLDPAGRRVEVRHA